MNDKNSKPMKVFRVLVATTLLLGGIGMTTIEMSEARSRFVFRSPQRRNPPFTLGAASRSGFCRDQREPLTVLAPSNQVNLTSTDQLALLAYVPKTSARSLRLVLETQPSSRASRSQRIYEAVVPVPTTSGIVRLPLHSATTPKLQPNQIYRWTIALRCNEEERSDDAIAQGWVEYVPPSSSLAQALKKAAPEGRPALFAEAGIWHDALLSLDETRQPSSATWRNDWRSLLGAARLESFSNAQRIQRW